MAVLKVRLKPDARLSDGTLIGEWLPVYVSRDETGPYIAPVDADVLEAALASAGILAD
jgi:hypothetical protein